MTYDVLTKSFEYYIHTYIHTYAYIHNIYIHTYLVALTEKGKANGLGGLDSKVTL
jgi:hypothetical protein